MGQPAAMKTVKRGALLFLSLTLSLAAPGRSAEEFEKVGTIGGQFLKIGVGARATAMAGAFVAVADDASATYWNPAGIARLDGQCLSLHQVRWFADVEMMQACYVVQFPFAPGSFAIHARSLWMDRQPVRTVFRPEGDGTTFDAGDLSIGLTYARSLTDKFSTGITFHYIQSTLASYTAAGGSFDFGTLYDTGYRSLTIGMSIQSIGSEMTFIEDPMKLPTIFRVGMAMDLVKTARHRLLASGEFQHPPDNAERANAGMEYTVSDYVFARGGYFFRFDQERFALGGGLRIPQAGGLNVQADYSYTENRDLPAVHRLSLDLRF